MFVEDGKYDPNAIDKRPGTVAIISIMQKYSNMIKIIICDDEKPFQNILQNCIEKYCSEREVEFSIKCFDSGASLIKDMSGIAEYDIVFLDINMEETDGIEVAREIRRFNPDIFIVFVTAYIKYSLEGYKVNAIRYILKDNEENLNDSVRECLNTIFKKMNYKEPVEQFDFVEGTRNINIEKIIYIESVLHKLIFHLADENETAYTMYETLNNIEKRMNNYLFVRIHQSFLVNLRHIRRVNDNSIKMKTRTVELYDGKELIIPKSRCRAVKEAIVAYRGEM